MTCFKCGSDNVQVQVINEQKLVTKHHGCLWWLFIGWWLEIILWLFLTLPRLIVFIFQLFGFGKKKQIINNAVSKHVCQNCGNVW